MSPTTFDAIEGGCLCGDIRYKVTFTKSPEDPQNQPFLAAICHCTQCRKESGALLMHFIILNPPTAIEWLSSARPKEYISSYKAKRGFCGSCGSSLTYESILDPHVHAPVFALMTGSIDQKYLQGEEGKALSKASIQVWCDRAVKGVTDELFEYAERHAGNA
ncbi:hypothetical protein CYLTODRAFT_442179 [Cylindrobasidium torrendii FP15055 ss-10]|uniref:CENP-V/GFA domain-containing protein n=1 Tax=Cylindrobasidium torrendii FP15055 ss-10 TaxID=1314674 RepID=A0A0D7BIZ6_9AGAR|nr:hypothetical protein CYLTODRAFT_442179 [Cylindrobasidium torrendii FP15055 ss-10]